MLCSIYTVYLLHSFVNALKMTESYNLNRWNLCCLNYNSIQLLQCNNFQYLNSASLPYWSMKASQGLPESYGQPHKKFVYYFIIQAIEFQSLLNYSWLIPDCSDYPEPVIHFWYIFVCQHPWFPTKGTKFC